MKPRIWFLKERKENDPYEEAFTAAGWTVAFQPVLAFEFISPDILSEYLIKRSAEFEGLVVTSQRSLEAMKKMDRQARTTVEGLWRHKPAFFVGAETLAMAPFTFDRPIVGQAGGAELAASIIQMSSPSSRPLLFLCGNLRRDELPSLLQAAGVKFEEVVVYKTQGNSKDSTLSTTGLEILKASSAWVALFSPSGAEALAQVYEPASWATVSLAAIGPTTAQAIASILSTKPKAIATTPTAKNLLDAVLQSMTSE